MILYHITPSTNAPSIEANGLRASKAKGAQRVWLLTKSRFAWAYPHLCQNHDLPVGTRFVGYEVNVPDSWMRKSGRRGIWYTNHDIDPLRMKRAYVVLQGVVLRTEY